MAVAVDGSQGNAQESDSIGAVSVLASRQVEERKEGGKRLICLRTLQGRFFLRSKQRIKTQLNNAVIDIIIITWLFFYNYG